MKKIASIALLFTIIGSSTAFAVQAPAPSKSAPPISQDQGFTELIRWQAVNGNAKQIAISKGGAILALGQNGEVWQWQPHKQWGRLPGHFNHIAIDSDNTPWAIDGHQHIFRYNGSYWQEMPGVADTITAGSDGSVWIIHDNLPAYWQASDKSWQILVTSPLLSQIAIHPDGYPWAITAKTFNIVQYDGKNWLTLPEVTAKNISIGPEGSIFVIDQEQRLLRWVAGQKKWEDLYKTTSSVAVGPHGKPWIITPESQILASAFFDELPTSHVKTQSDAILNATKKNDDFGLNGSGSSLAVVGTPGTGSGALAARPNEPLEYRKVDGKMRDIAIGADGSVFAITFEGALVRWNNTRNTFIPFPGQFSQIAVAPDGKPWGIAATGEVFHFDGTTWQQIPQTQAKDIAIGFDGTIIIVDANLFLQRFDTKQNSFTRLPLDENGNPPSGRQVAVTPSGKPWVIDHDGFINSCEKKSCKRLAIKAISLAIGPEGSILIIDSNRQLKRWSSHKKTFDTIESIVDLVSQVAVGPRGKPWLLSTSSELWASAFFPRDESRDLITTGSANAQQNASTPPSPPVFRFTESRLFEKISNIVSPFNLPLEFGTQQIAISPTSGQATLIDADHNFYSFRDSSRALVRNTRIAAPESLSGDSIRSFIIDKDENYWISSYFENSVWRYQRNSWTQIPHDWSSGSGSITIARSPDNTIYATGTDGQLYRYDTSRQRFTQVTMPLPNGRINGIAISADNHFWVTSDVGTAGLYEYTGNRWVLRLPNNNNWLGECTSEVNTCLATGAEGSIYTLDTSSPSYYQLQRWNPSTGSWQSFNNSPNLSIRARFVIGNDGRPWAIQRSSAGTGEGLYRAR